MICTFKGLFCCYLSALLLPYFLAGSILSMKPLISLSSASEELCDNPWYVENSTFFINVLRNEAVICPHLKGTTGSQSP